MHIVPQLNRVDFYFFFFSLSLVFFNIIFVWFSFLSGVLRLLLSLFITNAEYSTNIINIRILWYWFCCEPMVISAILGTINAAYSRNPFHLDQNRKKNTHSCVRSRKKNGNFFFHFANIQFVATRHVVAFSV